jgi:hypothetical protein
VYPMTHDTRTLPHVRYTVCIPTAVGILTGREVCVCAAPTCVLSAVAVHRAADSVAFSMALDTHTRAHTHTHIHQRWQ